MLAMFPHAAPLESLIGGAMIGTAAALMLLGVGRIAGISGLTAQFLGLGGGATSGRSRRGRAMAAAFVIGLPLGAALMALKWPVAPQIGASPTLLVIGGLLVGFGTRLGSGCTSGHGVCGLSRLSGRSMLATALFMGTAFVTVALLRLGGAF